MACSIYTGEGLKVAVNVSLRDARRIAKNYVSERGEAVEICDAATGETVEIVG